MCIKIKAQKPMHKEKGTPEMKAKNVYTLIIATLFLIVLILTAACSPDGNPDDINSAENTEVIPINIGEGSISFIFEVKDDEENITVWKIHTNETTVGAALLETGLIKGTTSDMGLMVEYVDGLRADYMEDNAWWAFYINGEMAMAGVDSTEIEEGNLYAFIFTPA